MGLNQVVRGQFGGVVVFIDRIRASFVDVGWGIFRHHSTTVKVLCGVFWVGWEVVLLVFFYAKFIRRGNSL